MITEIAIVDVKPGAGDEFAAAYAKAHELLATTPGCRSARMMRSEESPDRFVGVVEWESKQHHLEHFRGTDRYAAYGALLGPYLAAQPRVEHFEAV
ncbi:antibiotic biosynthesis monooxygenase [Amycolatopsis sp. NPDC005232]|uniref:antibiotic biosynthesis monooxygenase family protein n=1 Tax=unclassified Amycolatopsis TaxID=2618356 RepID=UPI001C69CB8A|nr:antibiotic biosynthesis monooxygenase [Amycolatopsis sp. DSM 110486]QYN18176.1 antibiotic biosynthesis monooxygenase [Amycolatopsis sp. DSM 110486]